MVGALLLVVIGEEDGKTVGGDETQGGDLIFVRPGQGVIGQIQTRQSDWDGVGIIQLDEIIDKRDFPIGQPLIDLQRIRDSGT
ncbi:MAG: hypothetical protein BWY71_01662 [Planctomycetes bacterium ADurb.Bin412]|nr:MAG: hypothetical protein BWY71_01662 [Planctomycetes bacterium ADurb.Bin412]